MRSSPGSASASEEIVSRETSPCPALISSHQFSGACSALGTQLLTGLLQWASRAHHYRKLWWSERARTALIFFRFTSSGPEDRCWRRATSDSSAQHGEGDHHCGDGPSGW